MILICTHLFVPLRYAPSHKSEMVSQILFGEKYRITDSAGSWQKVTTLFDNYSGWIDSDHTGQTEAADELSGFVLTKPLNCCGPKEGRLTILPGCEIYEPDFERQTFNLGERLYKTGGELTREHIDNREPLTATAEQFINTPYLWGGRLSSGADCSGLVQTLFKIGGIALPRDSRMQAEKGTTVNFLQEALPGDLLFFGNEKEQINHVAMLYSEGFVMHASGRVRIDPVDHQGICRADTGRYTHRLRIIKRLGIRARC